MNRSAAHAFVFSSAIIFFAAATASPALAQHGGGGGHASSGGAHFSGGGSISASSSTSHATSSRTSSVTSSSAPHATSPATGVRSAGFQPAGLPLNSSSHAAHSTLSAHATSTYSSSIPRNVTIGFPPRAIPISGPRSESVARNDSAARSQSSALLPRASHMSFYGDGNEIWAEPSHASATARATSPAVRSAGVSPANLNLPLRANTESQPRQRDAGATKTAPTNSASAPPAAKPYFGTPIATPPVRPTHPIFTGNGFGGYTGSRGYGYGLGLFGFGWDLNAWSACDPALAQNFGCNAFADPAFGNVWEPAITWFPADDTGDVSNCGDPCTNTWQDPPAPDATPATPPSAPPATSSPSQPQPPQ